MFRRSAIRRNRITPSGLKVTALAVVERNGSGNAMRTALIRFAARLTIRMTRRMRIGVREPPDRRMASSMALRNRSRTGRGDPHRSTGLVPKERGNGRA